PTFCKGFEVGWPRQRSAGAWGKLVMILHAQTGHGLVQWVGGGTAMDIITFQAVVTEEQVIRPPADVHLPRGTLEVTVKPVAQGSEPPDRRGPGATALWQQCGFPWARATGIDNEQMDGALAGVYGDHAAPDSPRAGP